MTANGNDSFSRLEISLKGCLDNYRYFRSKLSPATRMLVLVKANAYGHGAPEFASVMQEAGADYLAVALPCEGVQLRHAGITLPILVLTSGVDFFKDIVDNNLEPGIPDIATLRAFCQYLAEAGITNYPIHVKLDTGMHRLGFMTGELSELMDFLSATDRVRVQSIYTHLATADDPTQDEFTLSQIEMFKENSDALVGSLGYSPIRHCLNSAGIERFPQYQFDMVRLGIGIYGISALEGVRLSSAASLKVKIIQIKDLKPEDGTVGYGRWGKISPSGTRIATIPCGYADGVDRHLGRGKASFMLNGHRVPTIGNICMDMCMVDITGVPASIGDTVTVFGEDPTAQELADILGTIPYEIMTGVPSRVRRVIVD